MYENFQFNRAAFCNLFNFLYRQFPCKDYALKSHFIQQLCPAGGMDRHLRGSMQRHGRADLPYHPHKAHVLHDQRIDRQHTGLLDRLYGAGKIAVGQQCVDRKVYPDATGMAVKDNI